MLKKVVNTVKLYTSRTSKFKETELANSRQVRLVSSYNKLYGALSDQLELQTLQTPSAISYSRIHSVKLQKGPSKIARRLDFSIGIDTLLERKKLIIL